MQRCEITNVLRLVRQWITAFPTEKTFLKLGQATNSCSNIEVAAIAENVPVDHLSLDKFCPSPREAKGKICLENLKGFLGKNTKLDSFINTFAKRVEPPKVDPPKKEIKSEILLASTPPERELNFILTSPLINFDSDTTLWYSATQLFGKLNDYLGQSQHLDESIAGRLLLGLFTLYYQWAMSFYSHEIAHSHQKYKYGAPLGSVDFLNWWPQLVPRWHHPRGFRENLSLYERQLDTISGLNQQEFNASYQFYKNSLTGNFTPDEGVAYIFNSFADLAYELAFSGWAAGDINSFIADTKINGTSISYEQLFFWSLITALGSYHSWESVGALVDYLIKGDRSPRELARLKIGDAEFISPNISLFPHPLGLFTNIELPMRHLFSKDSTTFLNVGFGAGGKLDLIRLGVECAGLRLSTPENWYIPRLDFFGALNVHTIDAEKLPNEREFKLISHEELKNGRYDTEKDVYVRKDEDGNYYYLQIEDLQINYTTGLEIGARLHFGFDSFDLNTTLTYSSNDFIQNAIKGKPSGLAWNLTLTWRF